MILHITNDYAGSTVYKNLVGELDKLGLEQIVYTPLKSAANIGNNKINLFTKASRIIYSNILNKDIDRFLYRNKINKIVKDIERKIDLSKIHFIHAHTWYSDGGVAYLLHKKYKIPYILAVRSTDINIFQKYLFFERTFGRKIIEKATSIILISASYKAKLLSLSSLKPVVRELENKIEVIPNGVDPFWINNVKQTSFSMREEDVFNVLYIGTFIKRKNLYRLQEAFIQLHRELGMNLKLHIVGGGGTETKKIMKLVELFPYLFKFHGKVYDKEKLLDVFRYCDAFALPSKGETFGLVYVEALLQGLPLLYVHNEGIDGFYEEKIGEKVCNPSVVEIKEKLVYLINNRHSYMIPVEKVRRNHDWSLIAKKYQILYSE